MNESTKAVVATALRETLMHPSLESARQLEKTLKQEGFVPKLFGRLNQKSSIEAASESDRGIAERLSNAFDASLKAARIAEGITETDRSMTPRVVAKQLLCLDSNKCVWEPLDRRIECREPVIEFWPEVDEAQRRYRKYNPHDGLVTILVQDTGVGLAREEMPRTILDLNSDAKLREFDAIGQFGHGGSSSLHFCESCLIVTKPRFAISNNEFYWTLIFPEQEAEDSKQSIVRMWFADGDNLPLIGTLSDFPMLRGLLPGTSIWHYGYNKGGWIKPIAGPEQTNPWGRLGRLFFSYPLPFRVQGQFARTDTATGNRAIKGAFFRLFEGTEDLFDKSGGSRLEHRTNEKTETLIVQGLAYGEFSVYVLVLRDKGAVRDYVDPQHPVVLTLHGQNHGEMTRKIMEHANLPELASSSIVEVRLEKLDPEAQSEIVSNSREVPKGTEFTRELEQRLEKLISEDEGLKALESQRQEAKARLSSAALSKKMAEFLSKILSDAVAEPSEKIGGAAPGEASEAGGSREEILANDPPVLLEFVYSTPLYVPEGAKKLAKFRSDARPPRYSFHGDNPRCFAKIEIEDVFVDRLKLVGTQDVDAMGYGSVTLYCADDAEHPIEEPTVAGKLKIWVQCSDGTLLESCIDVGIKPKPEEHRKKQQPSVMPEITFVAERNEDVEILCGIYHEERMIPFNQCSYLRYHCDHLGIPPKETTYWGVGTTDNDGKSVLKVEINASNPQLKSLIASCRTADEMIEAKERYARDILLDCYQHSFKVENMPEGVYENVEDDQKRRAIDTHLNHDKAIRIATHEREVRRQRSA